MAAEFKLEIQNKKSGKCSKCREAFEPSENVLGIAALFSAEEELYGSTFWRHPKCAEKSQVLWVQKNYSKIKGWDGLQADEQEAVKDQFGQVLNTEAKKKKGKGSTKGKQKKRKAKKDDEDEDDVDDDDDDKPKKKTKSKKEKKPKDKNAPKKAKTGYMLFSEANRADFKKEHPTAKPTEMMKMLGEAWKGLNETERKEYLDLQKKDKERYERQLKEYQETGKFTPEEGEAKVGDGEEAKPKAKKKLRKIGGDGDGEDSEQTKEEGTKETEESDKDKEQDKEEGDKPNGEEA